MVVVDGILHNWDIIIRREFYILHITMEISALETATTNRDMVAVKKAVASNPPLIEISEAMCIAAENGISTVLRYLIKTYSICTSKNCHINWREITACAVNASQQLSLDILVEHLCLEFEEGSCYKMGYFTQSLSVLHWCHKLWHGLKFYQDDHMWNQHCLALTSKNTQDISEQINILKWLVDINCCTNAYLPLYILAEKGDFCLFKELARMPGKIFPMDVTTYNIAKTNGHTNIMNYIQHRFAKKAAARMPSIRLK